MAKLPTQRSRTRPCAVCRVWFTEDPRLGARQRACDKPECKAERKRRAQAGWSARNPDYWTARRLQAQVERAATAPTADLARAPPRSARQVPVDVVQDTMSPQALVLFMFFFRLQARATQDTMRAWAAAVARESAGHAPDAAQDTIAPTAQAP